MVHKGISQEKYMLSLFQSVYSHIHTMINWTQSFGHLFGLATILCVYKGNFEKYTHIDSICCHISILQYGQMVKIWSYGHIIIPAILVNENIYIVKRLCPDTGTVPVW